MKTARAFEWSALCCARPKKRPPFFSLESTGANGKSEIQCERSGWEAAVVGKNKIFSERTLALCVLRSSCYSSGSVWTWNGCLWVYLCHHWHCAGMSLLWFNTITHSSPEQALRKTRPCFWGCVWGLPRNEQIKCTSATIMRRCDY